MNRRFKNIVFGKALNPEDKSIYHKLSLIAFFAWVGLGADGLSSSCYGPSEAFLTLQNHQYLSVFVGIGTALTIFIIAAGYRQIIELFPNGGGGYLVASKLLSPAMGMISGSALMIDYILTIALSISSGADALFSFLPYEYNYLKLLFALLGVIFLTVLNLRGVKESIIILVPIFIVFIATHFFVIAYALFFHLNSYPEIITQTARDISITQSQIGLWGLILIILRAYCMGAGTYTGIEAISNGLPILREPKVRTGKRTMSYMAVSLAVVSLGLFTAYLLYKVSFMPGKTLNAVLFENISSGWNSNTAYIFVLITLISEAAILFVAAQAGFIDGPRVLSNMALDRWFSTKFAMLSDRLVTKNGIMLMGIAAFILVLLSKGSVKLLIVLYSINVFITFVLSQLGMTKHWWQNRRQEPHWFKKFSVNGLGLILTSFILCAVVAIKFDEGGWITILVTGTFILFAVVIKRHYNNTAKLLKRLDVIELAVAENEAKNEQNLIPNLKTSSKFNPKDKTAVLFVNGFNGIGLHTLFGIVHLFGTTFKNFIFVQIGVVDAGVYKGLDQIDILKEKVNAENEKYVNFMKSQGYYAEGYTAIGTDIVEEAGKLTPEIQKKFPEAVFFGGQLVFPQESFLTRWLHNYIVFSLQRKFYYQGTPFIIIPIRI